MIPKYKSGDMIQHKWNKKIDGDLYIIYEVGETHYKTLNIRNQQFGISDILLIDKMTEVFKV